ncbi:MAG: hypothetical protein AB7S80_01120 [Rhizobiaceae bacterium]
MTVLSAIASVRIREAWSRSVWAVRAIAWAFAIIAMASTAPITGQSTASPLPASLALNFDGAGLGLSDSPAVETDKSLRAISKLPTLWQANGESADESLVSPAGFPYFGALLRSVEAAVAPEGVVGRAFAAFRQRAPPSA